MALRVDASRKTFLFSIGSMLKGCFMKSAQKYGKMKYEQKIEYFVGQANNNYLCPFAILFPS